jgi:hypothetical protein
MVSRLLLRTIVIHHVLWTRSHACVQAHSSAVAPAVRTHAACVHCSDVQLVHVLGAFAMAAVAGTRFGISRHSAAAAAAAAACTR